MDEKKKLVGALSPLIGQNLAEDLTSDFLAIRRDFATKVLERASPGKFVETLVQCLQHIATGQHDLKPNVDEYLNKQVENASALPEGLRICAARVARAMYTMRNKRNIAHKNEVDSNTFDLAFLHQSAAWIMAELIRSASGLSMHEAGTLISLVQVPVGHLVEEVDGVRLVHAKLAIRDEILILLHSHFPEYVPVAQIVESLRARSAKSVRNKLSEMFGQKLIHGDSSEGFRLTQAGHAAANSEIGKFE
jgi:hypothetical protein